MNESFKTDPSLATSARAAKKSGSYLCASNVTPTAVRFIVSVFLCLLCSCRMSSTQMTCSHFRKNRSTKRQKTAGCRSRIISKNRPVPIFGRSTGASLKESIEIYISLCFLPAVWATEMSRTVKQPIRVELNNEPHCETANQSRAQHWAALWNSQSKQSSILLFMMNE